MAAIDLITNSRARVALPSALGNGTSDDTAINTLITACSRAIMRYCKRAFVSDTYDELYNGRGERQLLLRNFPIQSVQSVRYRPVTVMQITRTDTATVQARVEVYGGDASHNAGLRLTRVTSGVKTTTITGLTFAANVTLTALAAAVNGIDDSKWSAQVIGDYTTWPSADLYCPNGSTTDPTAYDRAGQGAMQCVANSFAELKMHTYELQGYQINARQGGLLRAIPYTDPELLHPEDLIWPIGINNFRIQYTAGFSTIPEDLQEACAQLVAYHFRLGPRETPNVTIPPVIAQYLAAYRSHQVLMPGG
jgi:hypothetical protein